MRLTADSWEMNWGLGVVSGSEIEDSGGGSGFFLEVKEIGDIHDREDDERRRLSLIIGVGRRIVVVVSLTCDQENRMSPS